MVVRHARFTLLPNVVDAFHVTLNAVLLTVCGSGIPGVRTRVVVFSYSSIVLNFQKCLFDYLQMGCFIFRSFFQPQFDFIRR